jgi:vancomycin permeability regulator SanA
LAAILALRDIGTFYTAVSAGNVRPFMPVPLSVVLAVLLATIAIVVTTGRGAKTTASPTRDRVHLAVATAAVALAFPLAQMLFFGTTDYRRPADAAVVFGAQVYPSGLPSQTLADRIATGVELYRQGLVTVLIMSGGVGQEGFDEAQVMRDVAVAAGVDPKAIIVDSAGVTTEATVANVAALLGLRPGSPTRLIAVSQAYHLPRVQLAFAVTGIDVLTVPAVDPQFIGPMPIMIAREVAAFWSYDLRVCLGW